MLDNEPIGRLIKLCNQMYEYRMNDSLKDINLTNSQMRILVYVYLCYKDNIIVRQIDIQNKYNLSNPTVTGILNRLCEKDFIVRINDGRCNKIIPSNKGINLVMDGYNKMNLIEDKMLNCLTLDEVNKFREYLKKIIINNKMGEDSYD